MELVSCLGELAYSVEREKRRRKNPKARIILNFVLGESYLVKMVSRITE